MSLSDTQPVGFGLRRVLLSLSFLSLTTAGIALAWPRLEHALVAAEGTVGSSDARLLLVSGILFAGVPASCGLLWRHAIVRAGGELTHVQACARYGVGSLVNSFAPCHLGDVVRAALLCRALPCGTPRRVARCFGLVQTIRLSSLAALALAGWLPAGLAAAPALVVFGAAAVHPKRAGLIALAVLGPATKVGGVAVALVALGMPEPLRAALAIVPALELAALLPLTPANAGAASAAISLVLHARGVPLADAVPASIVLHGVETVAGILFGAGSAVLLLVSREPAPGPRQATRYQAQLSASTTQTSWPRRISRVVFAD